MKKLLVAFSFFLFFFFPQKSFAEVIHSFDVNVVAQKDGTMNISERIDYDFESLYRHGIFRDIPIFSKVGNLYRIIKIGNVKVLRDGSSEKFSTSKDNEQLEIKIGNPDKTITGSHVYQISYSVENGIGSNFSDHDEIYWNGTGNNWEVDIEKASETISTDFGLLPTKILCFQGEFGSTDTTCLVTDSTVSPSGVLYSGQGISEVAVFPVGTFPKSILSSSPPQSLGQKVILAIIHNYIYIWIFLNIFVLAAVIYWYQKHKNKKRFGPPTVNFDIPKDEKKDRLPPALAGTIDTARLDKNDITATIFDLAIRKFIKLSEEKKVRSLAPDEMTQTITKLKDADKSFFQFETDLFNFLFSDRDSVTLAQLKKEKLTFYETYQVIEERVFKTLVEKGYYTRNPKNQRAIFFALGFLGILSANFLLGIFLLFLGFKLNGRTPLGDEIDYKIDGLKLFLKSMDRNYDWQAQKFYTVEQMIPYAMALGYIDKFMEQLKIIKPDYNPSWYSGYAGGNFYSTYSGFYSSFTTTVAPSSSSGSGGGGFSGGGGGGGGGGSW